MPTVEVLDCDSVEDSDKTLAYRYPLNQIGTPIPAIAHQVRVWLKNNEKVTLEIKTTNASEIASVIGDWSTKYFGISLPFFVNPVSTFAPILEVKPGGGYPRPDPALPKRPVGRPRTHPRPDPALPKRPVGRPRTHPKPDPALPKRPVGRPKKLSELPTTEVTGSLFH